MGLEEIATFFPFCDRIPGALATMCSIATGPVLVWIPGALAILCSIATGPVHFGVQFPPPTPSMEYGKPLDHETGGKNMGCSPTTARTPVPKWTGPVAMEHRVARAPEPSANRGSPGDLPLIGGNGGAPSE
ncbi:hypothetical protein QQ045_033589 [Rhodiola kirilowii]